MELNEEGKMRSKKNNNLDSSWNQIPSIEQSVTDVEDEELNSINHQLDQLNNALDELEQKNDGLYAQLIQLLESNRQARKQFQQMQVNQNIFAERNEQN